MKNILNRKVVLDTETTGLYVTNNIKTTHRIIEIGAVEIINRKITKNYFHEYINPNRLIDKEAFAIHKISNKFLLEKPEFNKILKKFIRYINKSELIIHNASFDIKFINNEFNISGSSINDIRNICKIIDTLTIARTLYPGKKNTLDSLCHRLHISNKIRKAHSAILDAELLAKVYLRMTRIQKKLKFGDSQINIQKVVFKKNVGELNNTLLFANFNELKIHEEYLDKIEKENNKCIWKTLK